MFKTTNGLIKLILVLDSIVHGNSHRDVMVRLLPWQALHAVHRIWEDVLGDPTRSKVIILRHVIRIEESWAGSNIHNSGNESNHARMFVC